MKRKEKEKLRGVVEWLSRGSGLPLIVSVAHRYLFSTYVIGEESEMTKDETDAQEYHALVVIGKVRNVPNLDVPTYIFGEQSSTFEDPEARVVDNSARSPAVAARNAFEYLKYELSSPAREGRPKILVVSEFPLLSAIALGRMDWLDFYFRPNKFILSKSGDVDRLLSAFLASISWSREKGGGLQLNIERVLSRPSLKGLIPVIKKHLGYLTSEEIQEAGLTRALLENQIEERRNALNKK